jgi:hypothetical protein
MYADDTIFFLKADEKIVDAAKWALVAFEALSEIQINYDNTEMIPMNLLPQETHFLATLIGLKFSLSLLNI